MDYDKGDPFSHLILLAGPTGSGKTNLVTQLDSSIFEVVSFDSRQVYAEMPIGTTQPTQEELNLMPHHLVGYLSPKISVDAKSFSRLASNAIVEIRKRSKIPILVVGTGFYLKAFLYGMYPVPDIPDSIRNELEGYSDSEVEAKLKAVDIEAYQSIQPNDFYRYRRALEVNLAGGLWSDHKKNIQGGFLKEHPNTKTIGYFLDWDRAILYDRINYRAKQLIDPMIEETKFILEKYGRDCPGLRSIGYNFAIDFLDSKTSVDSFYEDIAKAHRNYAKKQITWFRKEPLLNSVSWDFAMESLREFQLLVKNK
ncbi:tRNA (adenosine(37)-N6)-dimethylallyltransferase MiaA [Leptospira sp. GIMC2001]|uniref:tRNA (adenosine(37)-N6)-dimethylallyltransferase MiaA n=1 Tax=Leptospira sp. GIMC2001 TaxID=1513297 RepID=UPI00234999A8|nr:tRNA (adenosine(37)-N6)-dimethylallyltransferase MiaA [Leptospira sp. GIMC2001]WCL48992.1 tRNA (adenosine(37)-N6)-dimethylallyltransferase MiaA [Leptospira sp. GIMC2001]